MRYGAILILSTSIAGSVLGFPKPALAEIPSDDLVAYYPFGGNANDASGNGHHGVVNGPVPACGPNQQAWSTCDSDTGGAYFFDGVDDVIEIPASSAFKTEYFSVSLWVWTQQLATATAGEVAVLSLRDAPYGYQLEMNERGQMSPDLFSVGYCCNHGGGAAAPLDQGDCWQHVVILWDGAETRAYLNGVHKGTESGVGGGSVRWGSADPGLVIGYTTDPQLIGLDDRFQGALDSIRIYGRVLDEEEIQSLYQEFTPIECGPVPVEPVSWSAIKGLYR